MKRILHAFGSTGLLLIANFATGILIARLLGPERRGEVSQIVAWFSFFAPLALLGLNDSIVFFSARHENMRANVLSSGLALSLFTMTLALLLCIATILLHLQHLSCDARIAAWLFLAFAPLYQLHQIFSSYLQATHYTGAWTIVRTLPSPAYVIGILVAMVLGYATVRGILVANAASLLVSVTAGAYFAWSLDRRWRAPSRIIMSDLFRYGHPLTLQRLSIVCRDNLDKMILPFFISAAALGNYVVAATFATVVFVAGMTIETVSFPAIVRARQTSEETATAERFIAFTFVLMIVIVVILAPFSFQLVGLLFGKNYATAAQLVPLFLVAGGLQAIRGIIGSAFKALAQTRILGGIEAINSVIMLVVLVAFGKTLGPFAGVLGHLISAIISTGLAIVVAIRILGLSPAHMFIPKMTDVARIVKTVRTRLSSMSQ